MLANGQTVSSLCVQNYIVRLLHCSLIIIVIRVVNALGVLNLAVTSTGVPHGDISLD